MKFKVNLKNTYTNTNDLVFFVCFNIRFIFNNLFSSCSLLEFWKFIFYIIFVSAYLCSAKMKKNNILFEIDLVIFLFFFFILVASITLDNITAQ